MIVLSGADLVLPDRVVGGGSLLIERDRILDIAPGAVSGGQDDLRYDLHGHYVVPGFVDVHVHGVQGTDCLDGAHAVAAIASTLPAYGVTAFCPTSVASSPSMLRRFLHAVREARLAASPTAARVLPAHLESNFLNPDWRGAQPLECLRLPPLPGVQRPQPPGGIVEDDAGRTRGDGNGPYTGEDVLREMEQARPDIGIVTVAPELPGGLDLIATLRARGHLVSLGHSAASYDEGQAAVAAGARQGTHLFNRMPGIEHRQPGLAGALLENEEVAVEIICDGYHVHPAVVHLAVAAKTPARVMAITDATAGAGLPPGARVSLGDRVINVQRRASFLDDGTLAGSVLTMDKAFGMLVGRVALSPVDAAILCSTTPAREMSLEGFGVLAPGATADLAVLDAACRVVQTWIGGRLVYSAG